MLFPHMYVGTGSILVLCTEHKLTCNCRTIYFSLFNAFKNIVFKYTKKYLNTLGKCIKLQVLIIT